MIAEYTATDLHTMYDFKRDSFERTDSDLVVAKLFVLSWNECVALPYATYLRIITPHRTE